MPEFDVFALISDLHGNRPALEAVFARIDSLGIKDVRCLGDVVGYGADPEYCIDVVMRRCEFSLCGNHDWGVVESGFDDFNPIARESLLWTQRRLKPRLWGLYRRKRWSWLKTLPHRVERDGMLFVHASPRDPIKEYVLKTDGFLDPEKMEDLFSRIHGPCFVGHTHWPGLTDEDFRFHQQSPERTVFQLPQGRSIVNVGSCGQPRDGDQRACFLVVDGDRLEYHRVDYDVQAAARAIIKAGLSPYLAERLSLGR